MVNKAAYLGITPQKINAPGVVIEIKGLNEAVRFIRNLPGLTEDAGKNSKDRIADLVRREIKSAAPYWHGHLQETISVVHDSSTDARVVVGAFYARFVINGTAPRGPNWGLPPKLKGWARDKGINEKALRNTLRRRGTKPNDFVTRGMSRAEPQMIYIMEEEATKALNRADKMSK